MFIQISDYAKFYSRYQKWFLGKDTFYQILCSDKMDNKKYFERTAENLWQTFRRIRCGTTSLFRLTIWKDRGSASDGWLQVTLEKEKREPPSRSPLGYSLRLETLSFRRHNFFLAQASRKYGRAASDVATRVGTFYSFLRPWEFYRDILHFVKSLLLFHRVPDFEIQRYPSNSHFRECFWTICPELNYLFGIKIFLSLDIFSDCSGALQKQRSCEPFKSQERRWLTCQCPRPRCRSNAF